MIDKILKLSPLLLILTSFLLSPTLFQVVQANMASDNYQIDFDNINVAGLDYGSSENFALQDTLGQFVSGFSSNNEFSEYQLNAGYRQNYEGSFIVISGGGDLDLGNLDGQPATSFGDREWIITANLVDYLFYIQAESSPTIQQVGGPASFSDYEPLSSAPDYEFNLSAAEALFAFSTEGEDVVDFYRNNGSQCSEGIVSSKEHCWDGLSTSNKIVASGNSNYPTGVETLIRFKAGLGANATLIPGEYKGRISVTALPL